MLYWSTIFVNSSVFDILILSKLEFGIFCTTIWVVSGILPTMFFLIETKFVHDLIFDFFLFELLPPFLIVDFCFRTLDFNNSLVCNV